MRFTTIRTAYFVDCEGLGQGRRVLQQTCNHSKNNNVAVGFKMTIATIFRYTINIPKFGGALLTPFAANPTAHFRDFTFLF